MSGFVQAQTQQTWFSHKNKKKGAEMPLYMMFFDYTKVLDTEQRCLRTALRKLGCLTHFNNLYEP